MAKKASLIKVRKMSNNDNDYEFSFDSTPDAEQENLFQKELGFRLFYPSVKADDLPAQPSSSSIPALFPGGPIFFYGTLIAIVVTLLLIAFNLLQGEPCVSTNTYYYDESGQLVEVFDCTSR